MSSHVRADRARLIARPRPAHPMQDLVRGELRPTGLPDDASNAVNTSSRHVTQTTVVKSDTPSQLQDQPAIRKRPDGPRCRHIRPALRRPARAIVTLADQGENGDAEPQPGHDGRCRMPGRTIVAADRLRLPHRFSHGQAHTAGRCQSAPPGISWRTRIPDLLRRHRPAGHAATDSTDH